MSIITVCPTLGFNSFVSVAYADIFHDDRGNAPWATLGTTEKQNHLVRATDYIQAHYVFNAQPFDDEDVEPMLKQATAMMAFYSITNDLAAVSPDRTTLSESKTLSGVGTIAATYSRAQADRYRLVTNMLANLATFQPNTNTARVTVGRILP